jgi:plasmid stabilization system protein ParE
MEYKIFWSDEALKNLDEILEYLNIEWSEKEVRQFKSKLSDQLEIIKKYPFIFPKSNRIPRLRKAVLNKQTIIFY